MIYTGHRRRDGADDRIVELVHEQPDRAASLVYASDAKLRTRVKALGTQVMGSGTLLGQIAALLRENAIHLQFLANSHVLTHARPPANTNCLRTTTPCRGEFRITTAGIDEYGYARHIPKPYLGPICDSEEEIENDCL